MPMHDQAKMVKTLREAGYRVTRDGHGHWRVCDGRGRWLANFPATSADRRWPAKLRTAIRRSERRLAELDARAEQEQAS